MSVRSTPPTPGRRRPRSRAIRIRPASPTDLSLLVRHRRQMWEGIGGRTTRELDAADPVFRRWARREMRAGRLIAFVAEETGSGAVLGSGSLWLQEQHPRPRWPGLTVLPYLMSMFTERDQRHRGVATRLVLATVDWSRRRGYPRIFLHASTMGRPVYERLGFESGTEMRLELRARRRPGRKLA